MSDINQNLENGTSGDSPAASVAALWHWRCWRQLWAQVRRFSWPRMQEPRLGNALDRACGVFRVMRPVRWPNCAARFSDAEISAAEKRIIGVRVC